MDKPKLTKWERLNEIFGEVSMLLPRIGYLQTEMPGEAKRCVEEAYLKIREAYHWLAEATEEENIQ